MWLPIVVELIALQGMETLRDHAFRAPQSPAIHQDDNDYLGEQYTKNGEETMEYITVRVTYQ